MKDYGRIRSAQRPPEVDMTDTMVFVASNIQPYEQELDDTTIQGYEYDFSAYTKNEYILVLAQKSQELEDELAATKVILGVE